MNENSITFKGKEYVSAGEFAKRVGTTPQTINKFIRENKLFAQDVQKKGKRLLEWQTQSSAYAVIAANNKSKGGGGRPKKKKAISPLISTNDIKEPEVKTIGLAAIKDLEVEEITPNETTIDLSQLDPYDNQDCWTFDNNGLPILDSNGNPLIDYERLKTKVMAQTYQVKLAREIGDLIPKEELISTVQGVTTVLKSAVDNIAQKYSAQIIATCESITRHEFTSEEHTKVMNVMRHVPKEIFPSIQNELDKLVENAENK